MLRRSVMTPITWSAKEGLMEFRLAEKKDTMHMRYEKFRNFARPDEWMAIWLEEELPGGPFGTVDH